MREVDGYNLEPQAISDEPNSAYFLPAVRVTNAATRFNAVHVLHGEQFQRKNEPEALAAAEAYVLTVVAVNHRGQLWDRPVT